MYIWTKTFQNKDGFTRIYLQLVTGERVGQKVRQKMVANLGRLEELQEGKLDQLIEALTRFSTRQGVIAQTRELQARRAKAWGPALIFCWLWEELGLVGLLRRLLEAIQIEADFEEAGFAMVLNQEIETALNQRAG